MAEAKQTQAASPACARAFRWIMWGLLFFMVITRKVGPVHVDLLPDFVGWILIVHGLNMMSGIHPLVPGTRKLAVITGILSLFGLVTIIIPVKWGALTSVSPAAPILVIGAVLELVFIWRLGAIVMDLASETSKTGMAGEADFRRKFYGLSVILPWLALAGSAMSGPGFPAILVAIVVYLVRVAAICLMMELVSRASRMCGGTP